MQMFEVDAAAIQGAFEVCLCQQTRRAARAITRLYDKALAPSGIGANQFHILLAIAVTRPATGSAVARKLAMERTTLTRNLQLLRRQGLIETGGGAGRRPDALALTTPGEDALERALPLWRQAQGQLSKGLGGSASGNLLELLAAATIVSNF